MALKKSDLYSSLWASCDELRGGMDASQYKDYVLFMLFIKYVSDKYADFDGFDPPITIPKGASFKDMVALKGDSDIGNKINTQVIQPLIDANSRLARSDFPDFNDPNKLGEGAAKVERLSNLVAIFEKPELDFSKNRAEHDDILGDAYEYGNVVSHTPGERVRRKIQACSKQLKARAKGVLPTLLVVFDGGRVVGHVEPYNIRVAMYGFEQVHIAVPPIGAGSPHATGIGHGPKRKMTATDNTSISAIGALVMTGPDQHHLLVYRNSFAKVPLDPTLLSPFRVRHFDIGDSSTGSASDWIEIPLESC